MNIPIANIIEKIKAETGLSDEKIKNKISEKMDELAGLISEEGAAHIIANELNIKLISDEPQQLKIKDIKPYMKNIEVIGKITNIFDLIEFERDSKPGKVRTCIIGDETGRIKSTFWHDATKALESLKEGDILKITKALSKENNGSPELSISFSDNVVINPEGIEIEVSNNMLDPKIKKIAELENDNYASILGTIVQVFKPNFFYVCPECRKRVTQKENKYICEEHGEVEKKIGYVLNAFLDDGTDVMRCVFFNEQVEKLSEKDVEYMNLIFSKESEIENFRKNLIGKIAKVVGRIRFSNFSNKNELLVNKVYTDLTKEDIESID